MFLLFLAQALDPPPLKLTGPVNLLFSADDYPKEAVRRNWQGSVVADILVGVDGRISQCRIVQSSGYGILDSKTCEILVSRAKFIPAKDINGRPTVDVLRTPPIIWRLSR